MPIKNPALYAVVPPPTRQAPVGPKKKVVEMRAEQVKKQRAETGLKHAVERSNAVLTRLEERAAAFSKQIALLQKRKACALARVERLEEDILNRMSAASLTLVDGWKVSFKASLCPASVEITNEQLIPREYMRERTIENPDKVLINRTLTLGFVITDPAQVPPEFLGGASLNEKAIKAALESDLTIPGVEPIPSIPGVKLVQRVSLQRK